MNLKIELFYSKTCPYCAPVKKMLYEIVKGLKGTVDVEEIDAWSEKGEPLAEKYAVQMVPTIVVNGVKCAEGPINRRQLESAIKSVIDR